MGAFIVFALLLCFSSTGDLLPQSPVAGGLVRYVLITLCALFPTLIALVTGSLILKKIGPGLSGLERLVMAASIGFGVVALFTFLTGWLIGLSQYVFLLVTITACVLGFRILIECWSDAAEAARQEQPRIYVPAILFILLLAYLSCFVPPMDYDVLEYHLGAPAYWLREGRIGFIEHIVYSNFPFNTEMLYLFPMVLTGDALIGAFAAKLINLQLGILCILAIGLAAQRFFGATAGWVAALAFVFNPWFMRSAVRAYDTLALSLYTFLSLYCLIQYLSREAGESRRWCCLGAVFVGLSMGTKYPSFLFVWVPAVVFVGVVCFRRSRQEEGGQKNGEQRDKEGQKDGWQKNNDKEELKDGWQKDGEQRGGGNGIKRAMPDLLFIGLIPLAIASPWLIKNLVYTHNPVFPLLGGIFGGPEWDMARNARFVAAHHSQPVGPAGFVMEAWRQYVAGIGSSPLLFLFLPLALMGLREKRKVCITFAGYAALYLVMWVYFTHRIDRFLVPSFPALCVLCGAGFSLSRGWMRYGCRIILVFLCCLHGFHAMNVSSEIGSWSMNVLDGNAPEVLTEKQGPAFKAIFYMNENLKPDEKVLFVGEAQTFYCSRNYFRVATVFDQQLMDLAFGPQGGDISEGIQKLKDAGITHIYVHWFEAYRLQSSYAYRRDGELHKGYLDCLPGPATQDEVPEQARFSHFHISSYRPGGLFHASSLGRNLELVEDFGEKAVGRPPLFPLYRLK